jgi:hypothetical protein
MATSTSSRSAAQAARAGRSASELAGIGARLARARVGAAIPVNAALDCLGYGHFEVAHCPYPFR